MGAKAEAQAYKLIGKQCASSLDTAEAWTRRRRCCDGMERDVTCCAVRVSLTCRCKHTQAPWQLMTEQRQSRTTLSVLRCAALCFQGLATVANLAQTKRLH